MSVPGNPSTSSPLESDDEARDCSTCGKPSDSETSTCWDCRDELADIAKCAAKLTARDKRMGL